MQATSRRAHWLNLVQISLLTNAQNSLLATCPGKFDLRFSIKDHLACPGTLLSPLSFDQVFSPIIEKSESDSQIGL